MFDLACVHFNHVHVHLSDPVGTLRDFGCPSSLVGFGKAQGGRDRPLCLLSSGRQWQDYWSLARKLPLFPMLHPSSFQHNNLLLLGHSSAY